MCFAEAKQTASTGTQQVAQMLANQLQSSPYSAESSSVLDTETGSSTAASQSATDDIATPTDLSPLNSKGPWQSASENAHVHAVILHHMCQQSRSVTPQNDMPAACSSGQPSADVLNAVSAAPSSDDACLQQQRQMHAPHWPAVSDSADVSRPRSHASAGRAITQDESSICTPSTPHDSNLTLDSASATCHSTSSHHSAPVPTASPEVQLHQPAHLNPQSCSNVRSAAHQRLANPKALQAKQAVSEQQKAVAFKAVLQAAPAVLQDIAVSVAEAVSTCYLAEARSSVQSMSCSL